MDKAYEHVSWTYEPESNTANNPDEDVTTPQTTTVIHRHYHHHYHHHYTHTSPPPPTHSLPADPHSGHHRRQYRPNSSHSRVHSSPPRAQRQSSGDEQRQRFQSPPSPGHSSFRNTEQGSRATHHRRRQRVPTPQRRASTRRYREASNDHSASPSSTLRRPDSPDQSRPNSRERYNRERYARRRETSREIGQTRRRPNERRPATSSEDLSPQRFAALSLRSPGKTLSQAQGPNASPARPRTSRVFFSRRPFGSTFSAAEHFTRATRGELNRRGNVRKLFLFSILLLREDNGEVSLERGWRLISDRLLQAELYRDQARVDEAWTFAFSGVTGELFERLMTDELDFVYNRVAQLLAED